MLITKKGLALGLGLGMFRAVTAALGIAACGDVPMPSPGGTCRSIGEACAVTADCCGSILVCDKGVCTTASACRTAGEACAATEDCCDTFACIAGKCATPNPCRTTGQTCTSSSNCCKGLACAGGKCGAPSSCAMESKPCSTSDDCCTGLACFRFAGACRAAKNLAIGDPCRKDSECLSGMCVGWCTLSCLSDANCTNVTYCVASKTMGNVCFPWCGGTSTSCAVYGATCQATITVSGRNTVICSD